MINNQDLSEFMNWAFQNTSEQNYDSYMRQVMWLVNPEHNDGGFGVFTTPELYEFYLALPNRLD